jgi:hypothetical protein
MSILLVAVMILLYTFQSSFCNMYARFYPGENKNSSAVYSVFYGAIVALATLVFAGFSISPSAATLVIGCLNGAVLVLYNTMLIKASSNGPFSVTMIFNLCGGIILPLFVSVFVDGEKLSVWQYARAGSLEPTRLGWLIPPAIAGGVIGALLLRRLSPKALSRLFAAVVLISGLVLAL